MANILHSVLQGSELHEPKGIETASENEVYVADGAGSGDWKTVINSGFENYDNSGPSVSLTNGVKTTLSNDSAGPQTDTTFKLPASTSIYDSSTGNFNWNNGDLKVGDQVIFRVDLDYTVNSTNDGFLLEMDFGIVSSTPLFSLPIANPNVDQTGTETFVFSFPFYIGSETVLNNPARLSITADSTGDSVQVTGYYIDLIPRNPRYV